MAQRRGWLVGLFIAISSAASAGCALTTDTISLGYEPQRWGRVQGADQVNVTVVVHDLRRDPSRVSVKKNGYGSEMAPIVTANDVANFVHDNIQTELRRRGFRTSGPAGVIVDVTLRKYYNDFKTGFFSGDAEAEVILDIRAFTGPPGKGPPLYYGHFEGTGINKGIGIYSGENAKIALDAAFADVMRTVLSDNQLLTALLQSAQQQQQSPPPPISQAAPAS